MTITKDNTDRYLAEFERLERRSLSDSPEWLRHLRREGFGRFTLTGFPTLRDEDWKYTSLAPITETAFVVAPYDPSGLSEEWIQQTTFDDSGCIRLVFLNGHYSHELSTGASGAVTGPISSVAESHGMEQSLGRILDLKRHPLAGLNTALFSDGAYIQIPKNRVVEQPIHVVYISLPGAEPSAAHMRTLIVAGEHSQASIVESFLGSATYWMNTVTEVVVGQSAVVEHAKANRESAGAYHTSVMAVRLERSSVFTSHNLTLDGRLVRNDIDAFLAGEGAEATLNGLYMTRGNQHVDNHTRIDHAVPHCPSHELYKGIMDGKSTAVFNGKIFVHKDAQKTDAKQTNQNLLLSRDATINTKPQLEIYADDVRCTHGATIGRLDEESLFYLRSRGIGEAEAKSLLTYAFASDILGRIKIEPLRERLERDVFTIGGQAGDPHGPAIDAEL